MDTSNRIQPLPLLEGDKTLVSLLSKQSCRWFGRLLTHWQALTKRGNTINLYFYGLCLDVEFIECKTQSTFIHSFDGIEHALPVAEVLRLLGLSLASREEEAVA